MLALESDLAFLPRLIEQEWDYAVLANVTGDVFFAVVRPHLLLVYVLLKDVTEHVGVDLVIVLQRALVQMPVVLLEESEKSFKCCICNLNLFAVKFLDLMAQE